MLKRKALKKIFITSITIVILLMVYIMPSYEENSNVLNVKTQIEYKDSKIGYIYVLGDNDLLVRVNALLEDNTDIVEKSKSVINKLINNNEMPKSLQTIIPKKTKLLDLKYEEKLLKIYFSEDILKIEEKKQIKLIEAISYSLFEIKEIEKISIYVNDKNINNYFKKVPEVITKDFGINKKYEITCLKDIKRVVTYYTTEIDKNYYMVPVTSYINNDEDKIKIIIENLSSNYIYEPNLVSLLNAKTELINYEINDDIMLLNFNKSIFISDGKILEEVIYTISNSVFESYNVNKVVFNVENKTINEIENNKI